MSKQEIEVHPTDSLIRLMVRKHTEHCLASLEIAAPGSDLEREIIGNSIRAAIKESQESLIKACEALTTIATDALAVSKQPSYVKGER